jgi:hypothetical protein
MKNSLFLLFIILPLLSQSQENKNLTKINCDSINNGLFDEKIYTKLNGKYILNINTNKERIFIIRNIKNKNHYYVTKPLMKKIKKCKCDGIIVEKLINVKDKNAPKIIRD